MPRSDRPVHAAYPRTCVLCRRRKIKCDRQHPCSNCIYAELECVYPVGQGRAPKKSRAALNAQLSERLSRLEAIVQCLQAASSSKSSQQSLKEGPTTEIDDSIGRRLGQLVIDDTRSHYLGHAMWANLGNEASSPILIWIHDI